MLNLTGGRPQNCGKVFKKKKKKKKCRMHEERDCWGTEGFKYPSRGRSGRANEGEATETLMQADANGGQQFGSTDLATFRYLSKSKSACRGQGCINIKLPISIHCHFIVLWSIYNRAHHRSHSSMLGKLVVRFRINQAAVEIPYQHLYTQ